MIIVIVRHIIYDGYALMKDGSYTGQTVRLNRFTGSSSVVPCYEELKKALN